VRELLRHRFVVESSSPNFHHDLHCKPSRSS
jgi:hypothetical protein